MNKNGLGSVISRFRNSWGFYIISDLRQTSLIKGHKNSHGKNRRRTALPKHT